MRRYLIRRTGELPAHPWRFISYDGNDTGTTETLEQAIAAVYNENAWRSHA